jgi:hypothetical protein
VVDHGGLDRRDVDHLAADFTDELSTGEVGTAIGTTQRGMLDYHVGLPAGQVRPGRPRLFSLAASCRPGLGTPLCSLFTRFDRVRRRWLRRVLRVLRQLCFEERHPVPQSRDLGLQQGVQAKSLFKLFSK